MARPSKSVNVISKNLTKQEREIRQETEQKLRGAYDKIKPPTYLNTGQKKIFRYIVNELKASEILSNLDVFVLSTAATSIYWMQEIDKMLNENTELLTDRNLMAQRDKYAKEFFRCSSELSLSPAARAKIGNINVTTQAIKEDVVLSALRDDDD